MMNYDDALNKLKSIGQEHILKEWNQLNTHQQTQLLTQISHLDIAVFKEQQLVTSKKQEDNLEPFLDYSRAGNAQDKELGRKLISEGKVGCLLIAGGQGTRLRYEGPKGMFPVYKDKSLFELVSEKVLAASKVFKRKLPLAIMTSPLNHHETTVFFVKNHFFGLDADQVMFFSQGMLPFLDLNGTLVLENSWKMALGPDGNGSSLIKFVESGVWQKWKEQGIEFVNYILVDNALADPFDAELVGFHSRQAADVTVKCVSRRNPSEKVGIIVRKMHQVCVVEYSEFPEKERNAENPDGKLKHVCANLSLFCLSMDFIKKCQNIKMPFHSNLKAINGREEKKVWKFERFIFDILPYATKVAAILYPREDCFAPLKNYSGEDSVSDVQKALQSHACRVFTKVTGKPPPSDTFDLPTEFLYQ